MRRTTSLSSLFLSLTAAVLLVQVAEAKKDHSPAIKHIPMPIAAKGKPMPVVAQVTDADGALKSVTLHVKSTETAVTKDIKMTSIGKDNYKALIPATSTSGSGFMYQITAVGPQSKTSTSWYPVKTGSIEDKAKDTTKKNTKKVSKLAKAKAAIVSHPYISGGVAVGAVGIAAAGGGGGGGGGGGDPSVFAGTMSGTWSGSGASGTFHVTIAPSGGVTGSYSGTESGSLSGQVSGDGSFSASGSAGGASWSGTLSGSTGNLSGSGSWSGYGWSGSWSGSGG